MSKRTNVVIPCINSINLLPNIADIHPQKDTHDKSILDMRKTYAMILFLLFFPYCSIYDLILNDTYWQRSFNAVENDQLLAKSLEVIQNIQDVSYNCSNLRKEKYELEETTDFTHHEKDNDTRCKVNDTATDTKKIVELFQQLDNTGLEDSNLDRRSLSMVGERYTIVDQDVLMLVTHFLVFLILLME